MDAKYQFYVGAAGKPEERLSIEALLNKLGGIEGAMDFIRGKYKLVSVAQEAQKMVGGEGEFLTAATNFELGDKQIVNRDEFFAQSNVWRSDEFWQEIGQYISQEVSLGLANVSRRTTKKSATDTRIRKELPHDHILSPDEFMWTIKKLTDKQPNGEQGALLNAGYANLFYVEVNGRVLVAGVCWHSGYSQWFFNVWEWGERGKWGDGDHVFSRN